MVREKFCAFFDKECNESCEAHIGVSYILEGRESVCERIINSHQLHMSISEVGNQLDNINATLDTISDNISNCIP